jgi:hypothetical protein
MSLHWGDAGTKFVVIGEEGALWLNGSAGSSLVVLRLLDLRPRLNAHGRIARL